LKSKINWFLFNGHDIFLELFLIVNDKPFGMLINIYFGNKHIININYQSLLSFQFDWFRIKIILIYYAICALLEEPFEIVLVRENFIYFISHILTFQREEAVEVLDV